MGLGAVFSPPGPGPGTGRGPDCSVVPQRRDRGLSRGRLIRDRYRDPDRDREGLKTAPSLRAEPPFRYERVTPASRPGHSTHALGPDQVLEAYRKIHGEPPESWLLAIGGERFELGEPLSARAADNLSAALRFFVDGLR